ncbi:MAG: helix-turn-helix domain-containing protein [Pseudomonadota bacterium]|jgi:transcriptional regulator with XRE-family HTH domain|uniref:Transcriptional regulator, contains XRE-family HTH domain n=1 Tax=Thalassococcus halodurans TaxID=373675 RepID=A0A1H6ATQ5_9RHOB|nr:MULTISPECIES: helix-turn-helix transcriptional regulator [Thalassococcus]MBO6867330.1 helix-turn-helix domain-containing protein [Thalassococcus sp.]MEC7667579.1 helix-turn-helix domain-containing protein [Pseudomonadota bacterium]MEC8580592.1 helix-turn-helix domain-containing protein [Pseudomonadota bacterium]SEG52079.1 Transcriptional regulator, contains XRE-family HTH domain [Thalassococcus halodurans]
MSTDDWYGPETATFGDRIAAARDAAGMTPEQFARRIGVKLKTLQNWEADISEPRANKLSMISGLLNVSIGWLLMGEGDGVEAPLDETAPSADVKAVLQDMRDLQVEIKSMAGRMSRLEKRLRTAIANGG